MEELSFGRYLTGKRLEKDMTLRGFAGKLGLSAVYVSKIEKERKPAPPEDVLKRITSVLLLNKAETEEMLDLAARSHSKPAVSSDLPEYIMERDIVRIALRTAKDVDATDKEWQDFIERLQKRIKPNPDGNRTEDD
jgi:transcriptional regulator with XRE-family HTH domain